MTLVLRPQTLADLPDLWRWMYGTPDAEWKRWDAPYFHGTTPELSYIDYAAKAISRPHNPNMQIIEIGGLARGMVTRHWEDPKAGGWLELGILIYDPAFWSGGHGTRVLQDWMGLCFEQTPAHVLTLTTWGGNARMIGAGLKVGFRECARIREARLWQGARYDSVKLDLLRSEWPEQEC